MTALRAFLSRVTRRPFPRPTRLQRQAETFTGTLVAALSRAPWELAPRPAEVRPSMLPDTADLERRAFIRGHVLAAYSRADMAAAAAVRKAGWACA